VGFAIGADRRLSRRLNRCLRPADTNPESTNPESETLMSVATILGVQIGGAVLLFALAAMWYWSPRLMPLPLKAALIPLLLLHVSRTLGLTFIVPTVVDPDLPRSFAVPAAYGDLIAAGLALVSIVALRAGWRLAPVVLWIFTVEGAGDLINDFIQGARIHVASYHLGPAWYILTVLVPALLVTQVLIAVRLVRPARARRDAHGIGPDSSALAASPSSPQL